MLSTTSHSQEEKICQNKATAYFQVILTSDKTHYDSFYKMDGWAVLFFRYIADGSVDEELMIRPTCSKDSKWSEGKKKIQEKQMYRLEIIIKVREQHTNIYSNRIIKEFPTEYLGLLLFF